MVASSSRAQDQHAHGIKLRSVNPKSTEHVTAAMQKQILLRS